MKPLVALVLASVAAHAESLETADLAKLRDPSKREAEVIRLTKTDSESYILTETRLLTAPQKNGAAPLLVLTASREYQSSVGSIIDGEYETEKPEELFSIVANPAPFRTTPDLDPVRDAVLMIFNSKGGEIRPFDGDDYTSEGYYFDFDKDGILDRADASSHSVDGAKNDSVSVFELRTLEATPRTLLEVIFNWHPKSADDGNEWAFTCFDDDKDGIAEIGFGPEGATDPREQRRFTFRWDAEAKRYSAGDIPARSHIRVVKPGETLASIAKAGGLGYPVNEEPSDEDPEKTPPPVSNQLPYTFTSFKDRPTTETAAFFLGKKRRDDYYPEDSFPTRLPEKFWDLPAKQAALSLAGENRIPAHREKWMLAVDDRNGIAPPSSGWLVYDWGSSGCYSFSSSLTALHFGVEDPSLIVFGYNTIGAVGRNPWADQPMHNVRVIKLTSQEARFLADTIFWLDRIRTFSPRKSERDGYGNVSSTADGHGTLTLYSDQPPREIASGTVWAASSISGNWGGGYTRNVFTNLSGFLVGESLPEKLGDRWKTAPDIGFQNLATSTKDRLTPRVDAKARRQLSDSFAAILAQHARSPIPPQALERLAYAAGYEALTDLLPALETLLAALPAVTDEDKEYNALRKRVQDDPSGSPFDGKSPEDEKAQERYWKLGDKRKFLPAAILREPLTGVIRQLRLAGDPANLAKAATADGPDSRWALNQVLRNNPEAWAAIMIGKFNKADKKSRNTIFQTLVSGAPTFAKRVIADLSPADRQALILEITSYHREHEADEIARDIPLLISLIKDKEAELYRRGSAMSELAGLTLTPAQLDDFTELLVREIKQPQRGEYGSNTRASAVLALSQAGGTAGHLKLITTTPGIVDDALAEGFEAIVRMAKDRTDRSRLLADFIRPRFTKSNGSMNDLFLYALAYDLRSLAPDIAAFASEGPGVRDGDGADYYGGGFKSPVGQRYHVAREITALWSETDPAARARLWTCFVAAHPTSFGQKQHRSPLAEQLTDLAAGQIRNLPGPQRREAIDTALSLIPMPVYSTDAKTWLKDLGSSGE
ncbi:hypothetical protein JIN84_07895 [Luteolibacter yonseiensis]|uniref:Uncharacterized protein n=1 Tax=Luteolibacter yonseiensis TaxID=1144680 RepID=A0A934R2C9_9BACT|nr:hypothetical protein [Luteolibacter yonseiensis]MBK1815532.1 hypothetical protein [Luteolibacter yonseiensis]